jgi:hypothetical protein
VQVKKKDWVDEKTKEQGSAEGAEKHLTMNYWSTRTLKQGGLTNAFRYVPYRYSDMSPFRYPKKKRGETYPSLGTSTKLSPILQLLSVIFQAGMPGPCGL